MDAKGSGGEAYLRAVLDALPSPVLVIDAGLVIHDANAAARALSETGGDVVSRRFCGDVLRCVNAVGSAGGCGTTEACPDCVLRQTAQSVRDGERTFRRCARMTVLRAGEERSVIYLVSGAPLRHADEDRILLVLEDVTELMALRRVFPICAHCRKVRDDEDFWHSVEDYLRRHGGVQFSHGICPDCLRTLYPDDAEAIERSMRDHGERREGGGTPALG